MTVQEIIKNNSVSRIYLFINLMCITLISYSQSPSISYINDIMEDISVNIDVNEGLDWESILEELSAYTEHPLNINEATKAQLEQFPFLSEQHIENILSYIYINGPMETIYELQMVEGLDYETVHRLANFVCAKPVDKPVDFYWKNIFKYGRHEVLSRLDIPFYKRKGYSTAYLGPSIYQSTKYNFSYHDHIYLGVLGEKDAGEPWGALYNKKGYDFYSYYLLLKDIKWLKTLALGNYKLSFGQGLVINTNFLVGKNFYPGLRFSADGIKKHSSSDEYNYFRGAAATIGISNYLLLSGFYSHRALDGNLSGDTITSIYKTGLHRSRNEERKIKQLTMQLYGGNLTFLYHTFKLGLTGIYYSFNHTYQPAYRDYNRFYLRGKDFYNIGLDYAYRLRGFSWQGEAANGKKGFALLNRFSYEHLDGYKLMLVHRYYAHNYWAFYARSFSESGYVQNENGWYVAAEVSALRRWKFFAGVDFFSFPWLKYRVSKPSQGIELNGQVYYNPSNKVDMNVSYRFKRRERDITGTSGELILPTYQHKLRYRINYMPINSLKLYTKVDYTCFMQQKINYGYMVAESIRYSLSRFPLQLELQGGFFATDNYDSRVYMSERGLLYTFYTPSFSGKGFRFSGFIRYDLSNYLMILLKYGQTSYLDRQTIGTGYDLINGNRKSDLQMQIRLKF